MNCQFTVKIGTANKTVFLKNGFITTKAPRDNIHNHRYTELHVILGGSAEFKVGDTVYNVNSGDVFAVPCNVMHTCISSTSSVRHFAFQIDAPVAEFKVCTLSESFVTEFFDILSKTELSKISAYVSVICADFYPDCKQQTSEITDVAYLIFEFFATRYNEDVSLCDLAEQLHFSKKHTERLVIKHTGMTFKQKLISHRMSIAKYLNETTDMSLTDISRYVGYNSYSGFWKNYKEN